MSALVTGTDMHSYLEQVCARCEEVQRRNPDMTKQQVLDFVEKEMRL